VDIIDCILVGQYLEGLNPEPFYVEAADVNYDGVINEDDAFLICTVIPL